MVEVFYQPIGGAENEVEVASKPEGVLCIECITTMATMWPKLTAEQHLDVVMSDPHQAETIVQASDIRCGRAVLPELQNQSVSAIADANGSTRQKLHGWTRERYTSAFGKAPEQAGLQSTMETNVLSGAKEQVFWTAPPQGPSYEKVFSVGFRCEKNESMLEPQARIHPNQAAEIFDRGFRDQVLGDFGTLDLPSMARMYLQPPTDLRAGCPGAITMGTRIAPMPPVMQPGGSLAPRAVNPFNFVRTVALGTSLMHRPVGHVAMIESGSAVKRDASSSASPQPPVVRPKFNTQSSIPAATSVAGTAVINTEASPSPPSAKVRHAIPGLGTSTQVLNLGDLTGKGAKASLANIGGGSARKRRQPDDFATSVCGSEFKDVNKFQRPMMKYPMQSFIDQDSPIADAVTILKRAHTQAKDANSDLAPELWEHIKRVTSGGSLQWMTLRNVNVDEMFVHINNLKDVYAHLPQRTWSYCIARKALESSGPALDKQELFGRIMPHKNGIKVPYSLRNLVAWCDHFSTEELTKTLWPRTINDLFKEIHSRYISKGQGAVAVLYAFGKETVDRFKELPDEYKEGYSSTLSRGRGVMLLLGRVPFEGDSTLKDGKEFLVSVEQAIRESQYFNGLKDAIWSRVASEQHTWPRVLEALAVLKTFDAGQIEHPPKLPEKIAATVDHVLTNTPKWKVAIRDTALPDTVFKELSEIFHTMIEAVDVDKISEEDSEVQSEIAKLVAWVRKASGLWTDVRFAMALQKLAPITSRLHTEDAISRFVKMLSSLSDDTSPEANLEEYVSALPSGTGPFLSIRGAVVDTVIQCMSKMKDYMLEHWHEMNVSVADHYTICSRVPNLQFTAIQEDDDANALTSKRDDHAKVCKFSEIGGMLVHLKSAVTAYEDLGNIPDKRFQEDKEGKAITNVIKDKQALTSEQFEQLPLFGEERVKRIMDWADEFIKSHGDFKITAILPSVTSQEEKLRQVATGTQTDAMWHKDIADDVSYKTLIDSTANTLQTVDVEELVGLIKACDEARLRFVCVLSRQLLALH